MNHLPTIALIGIGFALGWLLPRDAASTAGVLEREDEGVRHKQIRKNAKQELLSSMFSQKEMATYRVNKANTAFEIIEAFRMSFEFSDDVVARIVDLDPEGALNLLLVDPSAPWNKSSSIAKEWARRNPVQAVRFFRNLTSYLAEGCLAEILPIAFRSDPSLVADVIRSKSVAWQERYLGKIFAATYTVRKENAPPPVESNDPFADDGYWITKKVGDSLLEVLDDAEIRGRVQNILNKKDKKQESVDPSPSEKPKLVDFSTYDGDDWDQRDRFHERMSEEPDTALAEIVKRGNFEARSNALDYLMERIPTNSEAWPKALEELEGWIQELEVIPSNLPSNYHIGPFLSGKVPAEWIARQPIALQRKWNASFVETWAQREPEDAVTWAMSRPEAADRDKAFQGGVIIWAHTEPLKAASYVEAMTPGDLRDSAISNTAAAWSRVDRAGAAAWLDQFPDSAVKMRALERVNGK